MLTRKWFTGLTAAALFCLSGSVYAESQSIGITQTSDDAEENANGSVSLAGSDLELVHDNTIQTVGIRFQGVNVPQDARVTSAYIQFTCDETKSVNPCALVIQAQAADKKPQE